MLAQSICLNNCQGQILVQMLPGSKDYIYSELEVFLLLLLIVCK